MGAIKFFPVREVFGRQVTDTGTGRGQAAEPQGGGLDRNWKPVELSDKEMQKNEQAKKGTDSFTTDPFINTCLVFTCPRGHNGWTHCDKMWRGEPRVWETGEIQRKKEA